MREKCRFCENVKGEGGEWFDDDYCSGKCKKADGGTIPPAAKPDKTSRVPASFADYMLDYPKGIGEKGKHGQRIKGREPKLYRRRFQPEKLNWGEPLSEDELKQAGLRCNRKPIHGDWDFVDVEKEDTLLNDWDSIRAKAKELDISIYGKNRDQLEAEIQEAENV